MIVRLCLLVLPAFLLTSCREGLLGLALESDASFRTDRSSYVLQTGAVAYEAEIPFSFTNATDRTIYVVNCNRSAPPLLEKQVNGQWQTAWVPVVLMCLSSPIVIEPGTIYRDTLQLFAGKPGSNHFPQFELPPGGSYRLVWNEMLWSYDPNRYPFGDSLPRSLRTSTPFVLSLGS